MSDRMERDMLADEATYQEKRIRELEEHVGALRTVLRKFVPKFLLSTSENDVLCSGWQPTVTGKTMLEARNMSLGAPYSSEERIGELERAIGLIRAADPYPDLSHHKYYDSWKYVRQAIENAGGTLLPFVEVSEVEMDTDERASRQQLQDALNFACGMIQGDAETPEQEKRAKDVMDQVDRILKVGR